MQYLSQMLTFVERATTYRTTLTSLFLLMSIDVAMLATSGQNVLTLRLASLENSVALGPVLSIIVAFAVTLSLTGPVLWYLIDMASIWLRRICVKNDLIMLDHSASWLAAGRVKIDMLWDAAVREQNLFMREVAASRREEMAASQERNQLSIYISVNTTLLLFVDLFAFGGASITRAMWTYLGNNLGLLALLAVGLVAVGRWLLAALKTLVGAEDEDKWIKYPLLAERILEQRQRSSSDIHRLPSSAEH